MYMGWGWCVHERLGASKAHQPHGDTAVYTEMCLRTPNFAVPVWTVHKYAEMET